MGSGVAKLTVSVPKNLISLADKVAKEKKISRSKVVSLCLQEMAERRLQEEMEKGYKALAEGQRQLAELTFEAQREAVPKW